MDSGLESGFIGRNCRSCVLFPADMYSDFRREKAPGFQEDFLSGGRTYIMDVCVVLFRMGMQLL